MDVAFQPMGFGSRPFPSSHLGRLDGTMVNVGAPCRMAGNERELMVLSGGRVSGDVLPNPDGDKG
jgi:hypothetical protein